MAAGFSRTVRSASTCALPTHRWCCTTRATQLLDQCGRAVQAAATYLDDEGSVLILGVRGIGLLDDRDLARFAEARRASAERSRAARSPGRFGFVPDPANFLALTGLTPYNPASFLRLGGYGSLDVVARFVSGNLKTCLPSIS